MVKLVANCALRKIKHKVSPGGYPSLRFSRPDKLKNNGYVGYASKHGLPTGGSI
jgi:hypothetical protein